MVEMTLQGGQVSNFSESVQSRNLSLFDAQNASSHCHQLFMVIAPAFVPAEILCGVCRLSACIILHDK
jgi:hypothetical protein